MPLLTRVVRFNTRPTPAGFWRLLVVREGRRTTWLPSPKEGQPPSGTDGTDCSTPPHFGSLDWRGWWVDTSAAPSWRPHAPAPTTTSQPLVDSSNAADAGDVVDVGTAAAPVAKAWDASVGPTLAGVVQPGGTMLWGDLSDAAQPTAPPCDEVRGGNGLRAVKSGVETYNVQDNDDCRYVS